MAARGPTTAAVEEDAVWLNNSIASRRFAMIVVEPPTEALPTDYLACLASNCPRWLNKLIAKTLMIPPGMIMAL